VAYFLAIDLGTESARAGIYSDDGMCVAIHSEGYRTDIPRPGWAEQDVLAWRFAMIESSKAALVAAGISRLDGVCISTTSSSVVFLDALNQPLRPALLWMDTRAHLEADFTRGIPHPNIAFSGGGDSPEWLVPKVMWVKNNEPGIYAKVSKIGEAVDYLTLQLTGVWVGSDLNATCKWNYDPRAGKLPNDLYGMLGIPELGEKLPPTIQPVGTPVGEMDTSMAAEMGLNNTPVVSVGGIDAHMALISLRGHSKDAISIAAGTSNAFIAETDGIFYSSEIWGPYPGALTKNRWLAEGGQLSSGSAITWVAEKILGVKRANVAELFERIASQPRRPHAESLIVLDDFMGNRTPYRDANMRGGVLGLSLSNTGEDIYRATVEGVAFGTRQVLEAFSNAGISARSLFFSGGIRHNPIWLQTTADVLGHPINIVETENLTLMATATSAAMGAGFFGSWREAELVFSPEYGVIDPNMDSHEILSDLYGTYSRAKEANRQILGGNSRGEGLAR
jgi:ribulose kinase